MSGAGAEVSKLNHTRKGRGRNLPLLFFVCIWSACVILNFELAARVILS